MKIPAASVLLGFLPGLLLAGQPVPDTSSGDGLRFSLMPRAFQSNPLLDETVITEMTAEGRKLPPVTPARPAYYVATVAGNHSEGDGARETRSPDAKELAGSLQRALAVNGYQPADAGHPPSLLIVYFWGAHTNRDAGSVEVEDSGTPDVAHKHLLNRAALVGGTKFAEELRVALAQQDAETAAQQGAAKAESRLASPSEFGSILLEHGPLMRFAERDAKTRALWAALNECYYVVASAYDYADALQGKRRLLWRTKMTVDAQSVSMRETLPGLIANAAPFLGVDMPEAATMAKRMHHDTSVRLGPLEVKGYDETQPAPAKR